MALIERWVSDEHQWVCTLWGKGLEASESYGGYAYKLHPLHTEVTL